MLNRTTIGEIYSHTMRHHASQPVHECLALSVKNLTLRQSHLASGYAFKLFSTITVPQSVPDY